MIDTIVVIAIVTTVLFCTASLHPLHKHCRSWLAVLPIADTSKNAAMLLQIGDSQNAGHA
jgi:hypothetical protein